MSKEKKLNKPYVKRYVNVGTKHACRSQAADNYSGVVFTDDCSVPSLFSLWIKLLKPLFSVIWKCKENLKDLR